MFSRRDIATALGIAVVITALLPGVAAAGTATPFVGADILGTLGGLAGGVFSGIGHAVLGAFSWTIGLASKFILTTIAALVHMLIPHSWITKGLQVMRWLVAVPNYAGQITTPGGGHAYGFAGINALRDVFTWLGFAAAPLGLVYATARALVGDGDPVGIPVLRMVATGVVVVSYPYWWAQAAALTDQVTNAILSVPAVAAGVQRLMAYAVGGVALGGWQLIDLGLMGATGLALLALIFLKVVVILLGALLYATGPVMIGLVPTRAGSGLARAWASAAVMLLGLGIAWASVFAVGAVLIGDSATAGPLVAGNSSFGSLVGGLLLAVAGVASLWICIKVAKEAAGLLRMQLAGLLAIGGNRGSSMSGATVPAVGRTTAASLRTYGSRVSSAARAAGSELALGGSAAAGLATAGRAAGAVGRRGLVRTAAVGAAAAAGKAAPAGARVMERTRAGALAARMARAGTAGWTSNPASARPPRPQRPGDSTHDGRRHAARSAQQASSGGEARTATAEAPRPSRATPALPAPGASTSTHPTATDDATPSSPSQGTTQHHSHAAGVKSPASTPPPHHVAPEPERTQRSAIDREARPTSATPRPGPPKHPRKQAPGSGENS